LLRYPRDPCPELLNESLTHYTSVCTPGLGQSALPTRLVAGLFILKHMHNLSDEALCARWLENPYYQFFYGELSFCWRARWRRADRSELKIARRALIGAGRDIGSKRHKTRVHR